MHLHGLSNKIGSSTRSASSMHRGVRGDSSESLRYRDSKIRKLRPFGCELKVRDKNRDYREETRSFLSLCSYVFFKPRITRMCFLTAKKREAGGLQDREITQVFCPYVLMSFLNRELRECGRISSAIASETQKCFEEAICSKDHARGPEVLAAWSTQEQNKSAS